MTRQALPLLDREEEIITLQAVCGRYESRNQPTAFGGLRLNLAHAEKVIRRCAEHAANSQQRSKIGFAMGTCFRAMNGEGAVCVATVIWAAHLKE
jgi:hypothetical protein